MPDRGLVKDKSDCGDPGQPEAWEGNQESVLFTGQVISRIIKKPTVSEAAEKSKQELRIDHWIQQRGGYC